MVTTATTNTQTAAALAPRGDSAAGKTKSDAINLSADFQMFLTMLTTQMQNQDPLNPVDSTEYATQLASFSSVEQQIKTNDLLREMMGQAGSGALQQFGGWIGKEVLVEAPVRFEGQPVVLRPDYHAEASSAVLVIRGPDGALVERRPVSTDEDSVIWTGRDESGAVLPAGVYRFEIESYADKTLLETRMPPAYARVDEIRTEGGAVMLRLADGTETTAAMVAGLRNPG
ncbi:flagellar hook capping FlgD N-terminal domain-containing protein [Thetidibacter halocola]|uniref:Basal-body rod modification protein FlgD n=1 Tax=Thetidibacter halocola TaxID=2827239 RepID=A0A8J7WE36_9RHOB|nr:flagellar hook capping FlgD N-terminal domain-containing protein [Thetidibacter halocola]MBS0123671.1 flagellin biosynthesis protein FlgD [Thetidibacter halocola]